MGEKANTTSGELKDSRIVCQTSQGVELRATVLKLTRNRVVFETYSPEPLLRLSEVLSNFTLLIYNRRVYSGKALVSNLIHTGPSTFYEAQLDQAWLNGEAIVPTANAEEIKAGFAQFFQNWGKSYQILPEYKAVITDIHSFLADLRNWLEQVELNVRSTTTGNRIALERELMEALTPSTTAAIASLFDRFEVVARMVEPDLVPMHQTFGRRLLHPLILAAPFVYRTLQKPLGYAGDYEMVNMMMRDPYEGASLFGKAFNVCALSRPPIVAHRNRLRYLTKRLLQETVRNLGLKRPVRFMSVGCGPAQEVQAFLREQHCSDRTEFTLIDFNAETLCHLDGALSDCKRRYARQTRIQLTQRSVQQIIKQSCKSNVQVPAHEQYDFAYCAGLFDYLPDSVCRSLISYFYNLLVPGGVLLVTNVDSHPSRNEMEYFLEWHLVYRDTQAMKTLVPTGISPDDVQVVREAAGINIMLEIRKPNCD
jgi:extracellular factor (EF) 3-hydroxypalmitic acid methyl ester biosynthesis protein